MGYAAEETKNIKRYSHDYVRMYALSGQCPFFIQKLALVSADWYSNSDSVLFAGQCGLLWDTGL